jgi:hypothetical protein
MTVESLLAHLHELETALADELRAAANRHRDDHDIYHQCQAFGLSVDRRLQKLEPLLRRYEGRAKWKSAVRDGSNDLLEELRALYLREQEDAITWTIAAQAAKACRDRDLLMLATECQSEAEMQAKWFTARIKTGAPQALVVR